MSLERREKKTLSSRWAGAAPVLAQHDQEFEQPVHAHPTLRRCYPVLMSRQRATKRQISIANVIISVAVCWPCSEGHGSAESKGAR